MTITLTTTTVPGGLAVGAERGRAWPLLAQIASLLKFHGNRSKQYLRRTFQQEFPLNQPPASFPASTPTE
ncbi:hypothetical protein KK141_00520 [Dyella sp. LX-66]|uniref:hypothetical protein n=1 Tax=unclassified Dyella TaxID=2634549 RepID=UPI001BDF8BF8|nr:MULTISPECIES: hypothetical protein [unclassified Dyella]MBT2115999.1 hypothetical protein [Dyella sp. LX-1]MBT2138009.1 hypothetical protein [Dyella sp. LX-66]